MRVLVGSQPDFPQRRALERRDVHAVIVDQFEGQVSIAAGHQQHVVVLQIGVRDLLLAQQAGRLDATDPAGRATGADDGGDFRRTC